MVAVDDVVMPRHGLKFESDKSFNRPSVYFESPFDLNMLSKYSIFLMGMQSFLLPRLIGCGPLRIPVAMLSQMFIMSVVLDCLCIRFIFLF